MWKGKSIFLWQIKEVYKGDPVTIARRAKDIGLTSILIKMANGTLNYNLRPVGAGWADDIVGPVVDALRAAGVGVIGWHYVYGAQPEREAEVAAKQINKYKLDAWIIDAEQEYKAKGMSTAATKHVKRLRELVAVPLGLSTYRYPSYHPEFAWSGFFPFIDFHVPQIYWADAHNPAAQLKQSLKEYRAVEKRLGVKELPYLPAGAAYHEHGWQPTKAEILEFHETAKALSLQGVSFWEWGHAIRYDFEDTIAALVWKTGDTPAPETPPAGEKTVEEKLADHEKRLARLEQIYNFGGNP